VKGKKNKTNDDCAPSAAGGGKSIQAGSKGIATWGCAAGDMGMVWEWVEKDKSLVWSKETVVVQGKACFDSPERMDAMVSPCESRNCSGSPWAKRSIRSGFPVWKKLVIVVKGQ